MSIIQELIADYPSRHRVMCAAAVEILNEALAADPVAINRLFLMEVGVNDALRDHPTIQVMSRGIMRTDDVIDPATQVPEADEATPRVSVLRPLGLINGLFGVDARELWIHRHLSINRRCPHHRTTGSRSSSSLKPRDCGPANRPAMVQ